MHLWLINPTNSLALAEVKHRRFNRYRIWKPLGLMTVAAMTPPDWKITLIDENQKIEDYSKMPRPDLVGLTAFSSQANRAYQLASQFRAMGVPVVMGGIHASMCSQEALKYVDSVVAGEAEEIWPRVLADVRRGKLQPLYRATSSPTAPISRARHDLLPTGYTFGAIQTTRGCPLNCSFCSVSAFNGTRYRHRPIPDVIDEMKLIREKFLLIVDDNLIGTSNAHIARAKELFNAMIDAHLNKKWIAQVTLNMGQDEQLLQLAAKAGCIAVFIGFESPTPQGLAEVGKKFNLTNGRDPRDCVQRIHRHGILVVGSFILGLDTDNPGIGQQIADAASRYNVDILNTLFLTPLPGTRLWDKMQTQNRIATAAFPHDWQYYTLTFPVADYQNLSRSQIVHEMEHCDQTFYSPWRIIRRLSATLLHNHLPFVALLGNLTYRSGLSTNHKAYHQFLLSNEPH